MAGIRRFSFLLMILLLCLAAAPAPVRGQADSKTTPGCQPNNIEKWVRAQIAAGQVADLKLLSPAESGRIITAPFLQALLTDGCPGFKVPFQGVRLKNAVIQGELDLQSATIKHRVLLEGCRFQDQVNFYAAHFQKSLEMDNSIFQQEVNCHFMKVDRHLWMEDAVFQKKADFAKVDVGVNVTANGARFWSLTNFDALKVGEGAYFAEARFLADAVFIGAHVTADFSAPQAIFNGTANFDRFTAVNAVFSGAHFYGPARFLGAHLSSQFIAPGAFFYDTANFNAFKCGSVFLVNKLPPKKSAPDQPPLEVACFLGPVNFAHAQIEVNFQALQVQFLSEEKAVFGFLQVGHKAIFDDAVFQGPLDLKNAAIGSFLLGGVKLVEKNGVKQVWLDGLSYQEITTLPIQDQDETPSEEERQKRLQKDHQLLLEELLGQSPFNIQNYAQLEAFAKRTGQDKWADEIFIAGKKREYGRMRWNLIQRFRNLSADCWQACQGQNPVYRVFTWLSLLLKKFLFWLSQTAVWFFWGILTGYGRDPFRVIYLSTLFICFGAWVFKPKYLDQKILEKWKWHIQGNRWKSFGRLIIRLSLSLDVFIPTHHPMLVEHLDRTEIPRRVLLYYAFHKLAGMILIPLAAAAFLTHLKLSG